MNSPALVLYNTKNNLHHSQVFGGLVPVVFAECVNDTTILENCVTLVVLMLRPLYYPGFLY